jgi:hypothetical protein
VLEWDVNIAGDFWTVGDSLDEFVRPVGGMGIEEADPKIAFKLV